MRIGADGGYSGPLTAGAALPLYWLQFVGFNTISITIGLLLIQPFTALIILVAGHADVARQIAHAHVLFNMAGVLLFAPLLPLCQRLLETWLPEQQVQAPAAA